MKTILFLTFMGFIMFFFIGFYKFCSKSNQLLMMLISLEFISLMIFFLFFICLWFQLEKYILMYYITFCVCEGAFGLSILVMLVRCSGNDYFQNLSFLKC